MCNHAPDKDKIDIFLSIIMWVSVMIMSVSAIYLIWSVSFILLK